MNMKLLKLLESNARYSIADLAAMTDSTEEAVRADIVRMEKDGLIRGYKTVIDWESLDTALVSALIELRVSPEAEYGFDEIAKRVMRFKEVETVYLMSGGYDLCVIVKGRTFQEVAMFVARQLAPMRSILSTATHFVLRRYKELDVELLGQQTDDRGTVSL